MRPTSRPADMAEMMAETGRITAIKGPSRTQESATESTPVSGVEMRNEVVEARDAPERCNDMAAGRVPQEQRGRGAPINAALATGARPLPPRDRPTKSMGNQARINPAATRPNSSQGAEINASSRVFSRKSPIGPSLPPAGDQRAYRCSIFLFPVILSARNRIVSPLVKRVTAGNALYSQPEPFERTVHLYGFTGIGRTAGIVSTVVSQQRTDQIAVTANQQK